MEIFLSVLRVLAAIVIAFGVGKLVTLIKLPAILGWLIAGMALGPFALKLVDAPILDAVWYESAIHILECAVGLLIGTELVWKKIKKTGKQTVITTFTQSIGTFLLVTLVFDIIFFFTDVPLYLGFIFGGIALATAPAPAISIVREFKTAGPVTDTLLPMAALDDMIGVVVFFTVVSVVSSRLSAAAVPVYAVVLSVVLPLVIGVSVGLLAGLLFKSAKKRAGLMLVLISTLLLSAGAGFAVDYLLMPAPMLNYMLIGMAFSATFSNMMPEERLEQIMKGFNPILGVAMIVVILNLGAPLDYHLILGAGLFTAIYIIARALGKYFGAFFGAAVTKSPKTVRNFLGFTLLPHSGVSLVFTGIAVSVLTGPAPECAKIIQGTIAAAAVINEIIAVIMAKKGFEWAGEFHKGEPEKEESRKLPVD